MAREYIGIYNDVCHGMLIGKHGAQITVCLLMQYPASIFFDSVWKGHGG